VDAREYRRDGVLRFAERVLDDRARITTGSYMDKFIKNLNCRPPATDEAIAALRRASGRRFPDDYAEFLRTTNGGEGFIGTNAYAVFWSSEELIALNEAYKVKAYASGLLVFGSNGSGGAFGFDTREQHWTVVTIPFLGMGWSRAELTASSFRGLLEHLHKTEYSSESVRQRMVDPVRSGGMEVWEFGPPPILGGISAGPTMSRLLTREEHIAAVARGNEFLKDLRAWELKEITKPGGK